MGFLDELKRLARPYEDEEEEEEFDDFEPVSRSERMDRTGAVGSWPKKRHTTFVVHSGAPFQKGVPFIVKQTNRCYNFNQIMLAVGPTRQEESSFADHRPVCEGRKPGTGL